MCENDQLQSAERYRKLGLIFIHPLSDDYMAKSVALISARAFSSGDR